MATPPPGGFAAGAPAACARADAFEPLLGRARLRTVGRDVDDALPRLGGAFEILLAPRAHDPDVEQRLRMLRIDRQRPLELLQRPVGLVRCSSRRCPRSVLTLTSFGFDLRAPPRTTARLPRSARRRSRDCRAARAAAGVARVAARPSAFSAAARDSSSGGGCLAPPARPGAARRRPGPAAAATAAPAGCR